jgi:peptidoglycan/xylan/chitin deacetylase (PgdA/CDA1 family)
VSSLKRAIKRTAIHAAARVAPPSWRWRRPGSLIVMMYHRVLPKDSPLRASEQPGMYVSPETLDLHLRELTRRFELVHLDDWLRRAKARESLPRIACAVTFDDGWRDNYDFALPLLVSHRAPATIFLVSSYIDSARRFWPNRLMDLVRAEFARPGSVPFPPGLRELVDPVLVSGRFAGMLDTEAIDRIIQQALRLNEDEIRALVDAAEGHDREVARDRETLNREEIAALASTGLVRFGSHSATHFRLDASVSDDVLKAEIADSRLALQQICGQAVELFCYPNGVTCPAAVSMASRHYLGAVSTDSGWYTAGSNPYLIPRIAVHEDVSADRDSLLARLSTWL